MKRLGSVLLVATCAVKRGQKIGLPASLEFRQLLASHTDTFAAGPMSAAELVTQATK